MSWQWWTIRVQVSSDTFNQFASFVVEDITNCDKLLNSVVKCCQNYLKILGKLNAQG